MVHLVRIYFFGILVYMLIVGCSSTPPALSINNQKILKLNQDAAYSFKKGEYRNAYNHYKESLKLGRSIENVDSISISLINLAIVCRKLGDRDNAYMYVDEILDNPDNINTTSQSTRAALIKAMLHMDDGEYDAALKWTDKALYSNSDEDYDVKGKIYNLNSKIALLKGDENSAIMLGIEGFKHNNNDQLEAANSLRLVAEAKARLNEFLDAKRYFEDALVIDKALGLSNKIASDLIGIGNTHFNQGMYVDAVKYYQRALSVQGENGNAQDIKQTREMIEKCTSELSNKSKGSK